MASRPQTIEDHQQRINQVLLYIQTHLDELPTLQELAAVASFSPYHFHRLFSAITGESVARYVRRIRLEAAAHKIRFTPTEVTTIALDAGYETPSAFNKAFKKQFSVSPTKFRETAVANNTQSTNIQTNKKKAKKVHPKIEMIPEQNVLFVRKIGNYEQSASAAWGTLMAYTYAHKLMNKETRMLGISYDSPDITKEDKLRYDACVTFSGEVQIEGEISIKTIAGGRYAIFLHKGPYDKFSETYNAIYGQWLLNSEEQLREAPVFEEYLNRDPQRTKPENLKTKIFVPLV